MACRNRSLALSNVLVYFKQALKAFLSKKARYPRFKSKKRSKPSYTTNLVNDKIKLTEKSIKLPRINEPIKIVVHRPMPSGCQIKHVTVSRNGAGQYFASIMVESAKTEQQVSSSMPTHICIDYKMNGLYVDSEGNLPEMPRYYRLSEKNLPPVNQDLLK